MKHFQTLICLAMCLFYNGQSMDPLEITRANYDRFVEDKTLCHHMIVNLEKEKSNPLVLAYLGALQAIWANHVVNPIRKFNTFNKGRKNIELAVSLSPKNPEIRFVRLSIQTNVPGFLGYSKNKKEDVDFLKKNKSQITSKKILYLVNQQILNN